MSSKFIIFVPLTDGRAPPEFELGEHDWAKRPVLFRLGEAAAARVAIAREPVTENDRLRIKEHLAPFVDGTEFVGIAFHDLSDPAEFAGDARSDSKKYSRQNWNPIYPHAAAAAHAETSEALEEAVRKLTLVLAPQVRDLGLELLLTRLPDYLTGDGRVADEPDIVSLGTALRLANPNASSEEIQMSAQKLLKAFNDVGRAKGPQETRAAYAELKREFLEVMA